MKPSWNPSTEDAKLFILIAIIFGSFSWYSSGVIEYSRIGSGAQLAQVTQAMEDDTGVYEPGYINFKGGIHGTNRVCTMSGSTTPDIQGNNIEVITLVSHATSSPLSQTLLSKWDPAIKQRSFRFLVRNYDEKVGFVSGTRQLSMTLSDDGSLHDAIYNSEYFVVPNNIKVWYRAVVNLNDGTKSIGQLYYSLDGGEDPDDVSWIQIGKDKEDDIVPQIQKTTPGICIGSNQPTKKGNASVFDGRIYYAKLNDTTRTLLEINNTSLLGATSTFSDIQGNSLYLDGGSVIVQPLKLSCKGNLIESRSVRWEAIVEGAVAPYYYWWSGDEGLSAFTASTTKTYDTFGVKNATVDIFTSDKPSQHVTATCQVNMVSGGK